MDQILVILKQNATHQVLVLALRRHMPSAISVLADAGILVHPEPEILWADATWARIVYSDAELTVAEVKEILDAAGFLVHLYPD